MNETTPVAATDEHRRLIRTQTLSIVSQVVAMALSAAQSIVVARLLPPSEYGLVGLALGAAGVLGVLSEFTLHSALIREISRRREGRYSQHVFIVATLLRWGLVLPNALIVFFGAPYIAQHVYQQPAIIWPLRLMALVMVVTAFRANLEGMLMGYEAFQAFYLFLISAFALRLACFALFVFLGHVNGYFVAELVWTSLLALILGVLVQRYVRTRWCLPSWAEAKTIAGNIIGLSLILYIDRLSYTFWNRGATALLGLWTAEDNLGYFFFALSFGAQLRAIATALNRVYLPVMSRLAHVDMARFRGTFEQNLSKVSALVLFALGFLVLFGRELITILFGRPYLPALPLLAPVALAFGLDAMQSLIINGALIPTGRERLFVPALLVGRTASLGLLVLGYHVPFSSLQRAAWGMCIGLGLGLIMLTRAVYIKMHLTLWNRWQLLLAATLAPWILAAQQDIALVTRCTLFLVTIPLYLLIADRYAGILNDLKQLLFGLWRWSRRKEAPHA